MNRSKKRTTESLKLSSSHAPRPELTRRGVLSAGGAISFLIAAGCGSGADETADPSQGTGGATGTGGAGGTGGATGGTGGEAGGETGGTGGMEDSGVKPEVPTYRVADAASSGKLWLWVDPDWTGWAGGSTLDYRVGSGSAVSLTMGGLHAITGLTNGPPATISLRVDGGAWDAGQTVTPTAASDTAFAVWADGEYHDDLAAAPVGIGATAAAVSSANLNKFIATSLGPVVHYQAASTSVWVDNFDRSYATNEPDDLTTIFTNRRHFDPLGFYRTLAPLETQAVPFYTNTSAAPTTCTATILGAAGGYTTKGVATVGLDGDGDPVQFYWGHVLPIGTLPDGRPFVVAPSGVVLRANSGTQTVAAGKVATWKGAQLCVVASAGQVPHVTEAVTLTDTYTRSGAAYEFAGEGWDEAAAAAGGASGLALVAGYEQIAIQLDSASATTCHVRFKIGSNLFPAQPLHYDSRDPTKHPHTNAALAISDFLTGRHRGIINYLPPNTAVEVQVKQGTSYWKASTTTKSYKPTKATATLGTVDGDVTITKSGSTVIVARAGQGNLSIDVTGVSYAEIANGIVRNGSVAVRCPGVILRDVDVHGADEHCIELQTGSYDFRQVRGRYSNWGRGASDGWGVNGDSALAIPSSETGVHTILRVGVDTRSPRYSSNTWQHTQVGVAGAGNHPFGPQDTNPFDGSRLGRFEQFACSANPDKYLCFNDAWGSTRENWGYELAGWGPNGCLMKCYIDGAVDDVIEVEGVYVNFAVGHNYFNRKQKHDYCAGPVVSLGLGAVCWGPAFFFRNLHDCVSVPGFTKPAPNTNQRVWKFDRYDPSIGTTKAAGRCVFLHETVYSDGHILELCANVDDSIRYITGRNNFIHRGGTLQSDLSNTGADYSNDWDASNLFGNSISENWALDAATFVPAAGATSLVGAATILSNINDAGPYRDVDPDIGARQSE